LRSNSLVEHDLFGKPVSTFPDHALENVDQPSRKRVEGAGVEQKVCDGRQRHKNQQQINSVFNDRPRRGHWPAYAQIASGSKDCPPLGDDSSTGTSGDGPNRLSARINLQSLFIGRSSSR
jgi:hypothetical protein